jgi:hypothetical protein
MNGQNPMSESRLLAPDNGLKADVSARLSGQKRTFCWDYFCREVHLVFVEWLPINALFR